MTHKEAAEQLRDLIQDRESLMTDEEYSDIYKHDIEALQFGINAIEQMEKGETANWIICCDGYYPFCSVCGEEPPGREMTAYCPNCGRRMVTPERRKDAPTIEAEPVKHGEWVEKHPYRMKWIPEESDDITEDEIEVEDMTEQKCSICQRWTIKFTHHIELNFCPLCGARMDGDTK